MSTDNHQSDNKESINQNEPMKKGGTKLFIGNLDRRIREIHILKLFQKFGEIKGLDFMFHKHGPHKGEPRGFLFLEYEREEDAERAISAMNGRLALGRRLVVNRAIEKSPADDFYNDSGRGADGGGSRSSTAAAVGSHGHASGSTCAVVSHIGTTPEEKMRAVQQRLKTLEREQKIGEEEETRSVHYGSSSGGTRDTARRRYHPYGSSSSSSSSSAGRGRGRGRGKTHR